MRLCAQTWQCLIFPESVHRIKKKTKPAVSSSSRKEHAESKNGMSGRRRVIGNILGVTNLIICCSYVPVLVP
jgi:hypothetical protein